MPRQRRMSAELRLVCEMSSTARAPFRYNGLLADANVSDGGQPDFVTTLLSLKLGNKDIEHRHAIITERTDHSRHSRREGDTVRDPARRWQAPALLDPHDRRNDQAGVGQQFAQSRLFSKAQLCRQR